MIFIKLLRNYLTPKILHNILDTYMYLQLKYYKFLSIITIFKNSLNSNGFCTKILLTAADYNLF